MAKYQDELDPITGRMELVEGDNVTFHDVTEAVARPIEIPSSRWWIAFIPSVMLLGVYLISIAYLLYMGTGIWGLNNPVAWGWAIVNFVFWVGIGHAGTLISAVLFLFRQKWRTSINRAAEAMTIFAVICALQFPTFHTGRPWFIYWPLPLPNQMDMWPNFKSPLIWDVFAVSTYFTVSLLFWYVGLIPDLATMRDRAKTPIRRFAYGLFSLGWRGSTRHWVNYEKAYMILAGLSTPLVLSVHTIVSFDFAASQLPGWHTTIFPPYFVAGAIFSGFAMVLTLLIPARRIFHLGNVVTQRHIDNLSKLTLVTAWIVIYAYIIEFFAAWYSASEYEIYQFFVARPTGPNAAVFWAQMFCNVLVPQLLWSSRVRRNMVLLWIISILVNVGMWSERFVIIVMSLQREFIPSGWHAYRPTWVDISMFAGTISFFLLLFLIFLRLFPFIPVAEVKELNHELSKEEH